MILEKCNRVSFHKKKMGKEQNVNLNAYVGKTISLKLNGNRRVEGVLRGYDQLMNVVLEDAFEVIDESEKHEMGKVVFFFLPVVYYS